MVNPCSAGSAQNLLTMEDMKFPRMQQSRQGLVIDAVKRRDLRRTHFSGLLVSNGAWRQGHQNHAVTMLSGSVTVFRGRLWFLHYEGYLSHKHTIELALALQKSIVYLFDLWSEAAAEIIFASRAAVWALISMNADCPSSSNGIVSSINRLLFRSIFQ